MKKLLSTMLAMAMLLSMATWIAVDAADGGLTDQESVIGSYTDGTSDLPQPDCGFSSASEIYPGPGRVSVANPTSYRFLMINLGRYSGQKNGDGADYPLDDDFFESFRTSLENARKNGVMVGIRFRFDDSGSSNPEPEWDNLVKMFLDIDEDGVLRDYADIIVWCEMGTLGAFGEQWGSRWGDFGYSDELIDLYLTILPEDVPLLLRTTGRITHWVNGKLGGDYYNSSNLHTMKSDLLTKYAAVRNDTADYVSKDGKNFSTGNLLSEDLARLGLYNDGYMGTNWDYGTYTNRASETAFLHGQSDVVYGGEFSGDRYLQIYYSGYTDVWWPINSIPEMYYTHLAYLHGGAWNESANQTHRFSTKEEANTFVDRLEHVYEAIGADHLKGTPVITEDGNASPYLVTYTAPGFDKLPFTEEIARAVTDKIGVELDLSEYYGINTKQFINQHLGYRFVIRESLMTGGKVLPGEDISFALQLENTGFHKINKVKETELLLVKGNVTYTLALSDVDVCTWDTGTHTLEQTVSLPAGISGGDWRVYLRISPHNEDAADDAKYGVRFANEGVFDAGLGANLIGMITVDAPDAKEGVYVDPRPAGSYPASSVAHPADEDKISLLDRPHTFETDGLYGYTVLFRVDGIAEGSEINLTRFSTVGTSTSGTQLHSFNWFFQGNPTYGYGKTLTENGYYLMYCPFYSVGAYAGQSVAGQTNVLTFYVNDSGTPRADKDTPTALNGNPATITPLGLAEGAVTSYEITFHYEGDHTYSGIYSFSSTDSVVSDRCQFLLGKRLLDLYDGVQPQDYTEDGIAYRFAGWTMQEGYAQGLVSEDQIAMGKLDLYPYYEIDMGATALNAVTDRLNAATDSNGIIYTVDPNTHTAAVGTGSDWSGNAGFTGAHGDRCVIPAYVLVDDEYYTVTGISAHAFESNTALFDLYLPTTITAIGERAFGGIEDQLTVHTYADSAIGRYADEQGITCLAPDSRRVYATVFRNTDGTILQVSTAVAGAYVVYHGELPINEEGERATDWDTPLGPITADTVFTAAYGTDSLEQFPDTDSSRWYADAVRYTLNTGLMNGTGEHTFAPNNSASRAMFVTVLWRMESEPGVSGTLPFTDVPTGKYYTDAVRWAYQNKVVDGVTETLFRPDAPVTREQFVTILYRYASQIKDQDMTVSPNTTLDAFADAATISNYARNAMLWAVDPVNAYVGGSADSSGKLLALPKSSTTRAMMATILYRFLEKDNEN